MKPPAEPLNPFYMLLLGTCLVFVATALAYGVVPVLQDSAPSPQPIGPFWQMVRRDGWWWLLLQLAVMIVFGLASMALDRIRAIRQERASSATGDRPAS